MTDDYRVVPSSEVADAITLAVIEEAFGSRRGAAWFQWKHRDGPWGPSRGYAAVDEAGALGVRLMLPWGFRQQDRTVMAWRAVEAATAPRGQRRGIFGRLNRTLMDEAAASERWTAFFSTPNALSRPAYEKLGWTVLPSVAHGYWLVARRRRRAPTIVAEDVLSTFPSADVRQAATTTTTALTTTAWTATALRWRIDPRSGHQYEMAGLRHADRPNGLLYRVVQRRGVRVVLIVHGWGEPKDLSALVTGVAAAERAGLALAVRDGPFSSAIHGLRVSRGASVIAMWDNSDPTGAVLPAVDLRQWQCDMADLESVL